jgi:hypothetical protein
MCVENCIGTPSTVLLRRECFERVGYFDQSIAYGADYNMWLRISRQFAVQYIAEPLVYYRIHDRSMSSNYDLLIKGKEEELRRYGDLFGRERRSHSRRHLSLGVLYFYNNRPREGREALWKAVRLDPLNPRNYFNLALSLLGVRVFRKIKAYRDAWSARVKGALLTPPVR